MLFTSLVCAQETAHMNDTRKEDRVNVIRGHKRVLLALSVLTRLWSAALLIFTTYLPLFDSSPKLLLKPSDSLLGRWISTLLRWDAIHFTHIAQEKYYVYEHERAFFLGTPRLMQFSAGLLKAAGGAKYLSEVECLLFGGALWTIIFDSTSTLYELTLYHFDSPSMAFLTSLLSLLPSSPSTLRHAAYTEPFFTYASYKGEQFR